MTESYIHGREVHLWSLGGKLYSLEEREVYSEKGRPPQAGARITRESRCVAVPTER